MLPTPLIDIRSVRFGDLLAAAGTASVAVIGAVSGPAPTARDANVSGTGSALGVGTVSDGVNDEPAAPDVTPAPGSVPTRAPAADDARKFIVLPGTSTNVPGTPFE